MKINRQTEEGIINGFIEEMLKYPSKKKTKKEEAVDMIKKLDSDPALNLEFNTLLRMRKIKKIRDERK